MRAFDICAPKADLHVFPEEFNPCCCGAFPNLVTAQMTMESVKNARRVCNMRGCEAGPWAVPDLPECPFQLVQRCTRCLRTMCSLCQCPNVCDAHGLHVSDGEVHGS